MIVRNEMRLSRGNHWLGTVFDCDDFVLCAKGVRSHFALEGKSEFTFCVSDRRPPGDDWYPILDGFCGFYAEDTASETVTPACFDVWANRTFPGKRRLYIWIEL